MCVCVYVCMYVRMYVCTRMHVCMYACMQACRQGITKSTTVCHGKDTLTYGLKKWCFPITAVRSLTEELIPLYKLVKKVGGVSNLGVHCPWPFRSLPKDSVSLVSETPQKREPSNPTAPNPVAQKTRLETNMDKSEGSLIGWFYEEPKTTTTLENSPSLKLPEWFAARGANSRRATCKGAAPGGAAARGLLVLWTWKTVSNTSFRVRGCRGLWYLV